jgi:CheY-like chemotaxis protein
VEENLEGAVVQGDEGKLRQVLINLLGNAVKFTAQGEVVLQVLRDDGDHYRFEVTDTGTGILPERQVAIFEPFQQEAEGISTGGSGLGLAIARRHVELMGGRLELDSAVGTGPRFFFTLELPPGQVESKKRVEWSRVRRLAAGTVVQALIVDDVEENRDILAQMLLGIGVNVKAVESGAIALEQARQQRPDIVFMDIRMPGMDGSEARRSLVEEHGSDTMKIAAVTASAFEHQRQRLLDEGFDAFIDKPFRRERIYACLAELLNIEFELAEVMETETDQEKVAAWSSLSLPPKLFEALNDAVETHSITRLKEHFGALEDLGDAGWHLAAHLRLLIQRYDMQAIKRVLEEIGSQ